MSGILVGCTAYVGICMATRPVHNPVKETQSGISYPVFEWPPSKIVEHTCNTWIWRIVVNSFTNFNNVWLHCVSMDAALFHIWPRPLCMFRSRFHCRSILIKRGKHLKDVCPPCLLGVRGNNKTCNLIGLLGLCPTNPKMDDKQWKQGRLKYEKGEIMAVTAVQT